MNDPRIREILKSTVLSQYLLDVDSKVIDELSLPVAQARIDIAVINGEFHGYEIKSASDSLARLPSQIDAYSKVFDYLTVITEESHCNKIVNLLPVWVGISICKDGGVFEFRSPALNAFKQGFFICKLLWKEELIQVLEEKSIPYNKRDRAWILCERISSSLEMNELSDAVRIKLKNRKGWRDS